MRDQPFTHHVSRSDFMTYALVFIAPLAVSLLATPWAGRLAQRWGIVARPGGRRQHEGVVPKLGGLSLLLAYLVGIGLIYWLLPPETADDALRLRGVVLGSLLMAIGGFIDDRWELGPLPQFAFHFAAAGVAVGHIIFIEVFTNPLPADALWQMPPLAWLVEVRGPEIWLWRPLALLVTLLWIVGMINTVNWLDGLDGLAAGVGTIAMGLFAWHSYALGQTAVAAFPLAFAAALLGLLYFNFAPARIFLGTGGAWLLAYNIATLSILSPAKIATALLVLALPILDGIWIVAERLRQRDNPLRGDRRHLHFRLADSGFSTRRIVLAYYLVAFGFGLTAIFVPSPGQKLLIIGLLVLLVLAILAHLSRRAS
jgi:UDP-GlcNAc:undecaprenyl-phosphate/decaprenyl-phosphate GlcNAc-1-phosphate transferase